MAQQQLTSRSKSKRVELILQQLNSLPTLPAVAARLLRITSRSSTQASEVVRLIESDPSLASRIMTLVTRGPSRLRPRTASISKAVVLLGFEAVRNAVLSIKVFETLAHSSGDDAELVEQAQLWKHSLATACAAKMLAEHIDADIDPEEVFLCGLLHDMGKVALYAVLPKSFARVLQVTETTMGNIAQVERKIIGVDHTIAGKRLAERWRLPEEVIETVWLHHEGIGLLPEAVTKRALVEIVHVADVLVRIGYSGNHDMPESAAALAQQLGCPPKQCERISRKLCSEVSERAAIIGLDEIAPQELYHQALAEANRELGQLNERLQQQNQRLQYRSDYFRLLQALSDSLEANTSVADACGLIADIWQRHSLCARAAAYILESDEMLIEGAIKSAPREPPTTFVVDLPQHLLHNNKHIGGFAVRIAGSDDSWFFEQVGPDFAMDKTLMMPLQNGQEGSAVLLWQTEHTPADYQEQMVEMQAFAAGAALALQQRREQDRQSVLAEQLAQVNQLLQQSQNELLRQESFAKVGELACGAAHEMNNPLAVVVGRAQLLADAEEDAERKQMLETIARHGRQASDIITEMLDFAQPPAPQPCCVSPSQIVNDAVAAVGEKSRQRNVTLEPQLPDDLPDVFVDARQIVAAIVELLANAIDAYGDAAGSICITGSYDAYQEMVLLEIEDLAGGMDPETLRKALDPFFSARPAGRGRGLGLSRSERLLECNAAKLTLTSEKGRGTTARVLLPLAQTQTNLS